MGKEKEKDLLPGIDETELEEMTKDFEETLTGFEKLEMAMDNWLSTDTGDELEAQLDELAADTAANINELLEQDTGKEIESLLQEHEP